MIEHLQKRGMNTSLYRFWCNTESATFPIWNIFGQMTGYHRYTPSLTKDEGRYYTYVSKRTNTLLGLEYKRGSEPLYIVEGLFKMATLHRLGFNTLAVLGATHKQTKNQFDLWNLTQPVLAIGDNDSAGKKLINIVGRGFQSPKDLDEMSDSAVLDLIYENRV